MWQTKGIAKNIDKPIIAQFTFKKSIVGGLFHKKTIQIYENRSFGNLAVALSVNDQSKCTSAIVYAIPPEGLKEIHEGDILQVMPTGIILRIYEMGSKQNVLFLTEKCNSHCIMCPQPQQPIDHDDEVMKILSLLSKDSVREICVSGGEPTINDKFINVMGHLKKFPNASPMVLTNGRRFSDFEFTKNVVLNSPFNTQYAIPLYSAVPAIHDQIVGTKGAFRETINGIYNLTRFRIPIEIRIVLTRQTIPGLVELAEFIGWNLPMVVHVAFMGMEIYGRADKNRNEIWIEPRAYVQYLYTAVKNIAYRDLDVSIYNLPLCLLPKSLWKYSERSISDWKQGYLSECAQCVQKDTCGGFFTTSSIVPKGIHKIV